MGKFWRQLNLTHPINIVSFDLFLNPERGLCLVYHRAFGWQGEERLLSGSIGCFFILLFFGLRVIYF
jgi:hypothetical protein